MKKLRVARKLILFCVYILCYFLISGLISITTFEAKTRTRRILKLVQIFSKIGINLIGFEVTYKNVPPDNQQFLIVGNHLGMLDILVLGAVRPSMFITSVELKETPFLGQLAIMGGCLFIERRSRKQIPQEVQKIREALKSGFSVVLYPEGTSGNGEGVLPLKKTLMTAAAGTGVPILPAVINFRKVDGVPVTYKNRNQVCWWGPITFLEGLKNTFSLKKIEVDFEFCEPLFVHNEEDRREVAATIQDRIVGAFTPIPLGPGEVSPYPEGGILRSLAESKAMNERTRQASLAKQNG